MIKGKSATYLVLTFFITLIIVSCVNFFLRVNTLKISVEVSLSHSWNTIVDAYTREDWPKLHSFSQKLIGSEIENLSFHTAQKKVVNLPSENSSSSCFVKNVFPLTHNGFYMGHLDICFSPYSMIKNSIFNIYLLLLVIVFSVVILLLSLLPLISARKSLMKSLQMLKLMSENSQDRDQLKSHLINDDPALIMIYQLVNEILNKNTLLEKENNELNNQKMFNLMAKRLAHDIRSPLAILKTMHAKVIKNSNVNMELFEKAIFRINDVSEELLGKSRNMSMISFVNLNKLIPLVIEMKKNENLNISNIKFSFLFDPSIEILVAISEGDLLRMLSNILNNSIDALLDTPNGMININLEEIDNNICINIVDNGIGMSEETLLKVNLTGASVGKIQGNGIGLNSARKILDSYNGRIEISSTFKSGTSVKILIPKFQNILSLL